MSFESLKPLTKTTWNAAAFHLETYLNELGKEFRKLNGSVTPAEIILIGGAANLANYGFRDMTTDINAIIRASSPMKDAINRVGDRFNLPNGWLNAEIMHTGSYSPKLIEVSKYYRTFSHVLEVRTVSAEYLVAMKLRSGRKYKYDMSDVVGILEEHEKRGTALTFEAIDNAVEKLYGGWEDIPKDSRNFLESVMRGGNYSELYASVKTEEGRLKDILIRFENENPNVLKEDNLGSILETLKKKQEAAEELRESIPEELKKPLNPPVPSKNSKTRSDDFER